MPEASVPEPVLAGPAVHSRARRFLGLAAASGILLTGIGVALPDTVHATVPTVTDVTPASVTVPDVIAAAGSTLFVADEGPQQYGAARTGAAIVGLDTVAGTTSTVLATGWFGPPSSNPVTLGDGVVSAIAPTGSSVLFTQDGGCGGGQLLSAGGGSATLLQTDIPPADGACFKVYQRIALSPDQGTLYAVAGPNASGGSGALDVWTKAAAAGGDVYGVPIDPTTGTPSSSAWGLDATAPGGQAGMIGVALHQGRLDLAYTSGIAVQTVDGSTCAPGASFCALTGFGDATTTAPPADGAPLSTPAVGGGNNITWHEAVDGAGDVFLLTYDGHVIEAGTDGHWHVIAGGSTAPATGVTAASTWFGFSPGGIAVVGRDLYVTGANAANAERLWKIAGVATPATVTGTEATSSSVSAAPSTVLAGCTRTATVTGVLNDGSGPLAGHTVSIAATSAGGSSTARTMSGVTQVSDPTGTVRFTVCDPSPEPVTFYLVDTTTAVGLAQTPVVTFLSEAAAEASGSIVTANPTSVAAGGVRTSRVTVFLTDTQSDLVGHTVELDASSATALVSTTVATDSLGDAFFTVQDSVPEAVTLTAHDLTTGVTLTSTAVVQFTTAEATASTVTAAPASVSAGNVQTATVTVTLTDGIQPFVNDTVTLTANHPSAVIATPATSWTDAQGRITFLVSDPSVETDTYTARDTTTGMTITQTAAVTFTGSCEATCSTVSAAPATLAAGTGRTTVTVHLADTAGPLPGHAVQLATDRSTASVYPASPVITDSSGNAVFSTSDVAAEVATYTATDTGVPGAGTAPLALAASAQVTYTSEEAADSAVLAAPTSARATGHLLATVSVQLSVRSLDGTAVLPAAGHLVRLHADSATAVVSPVPATATDAHGLVQFSVGDTVAETVTFTATDVSTGQPVTQAAKVTFITGPAVVYPVGKALNGDATTSPGCTDPATCAQHATEVEPHTLAVGSTIVSAFQVGRFGDGGAEDVGYAVSNDGGRTWTNQGTLGVTNTAVPGKSTPWTRIDDVSVGYVARTAFSATPTWLIAFDAMTPSPLGGAGGVAVVVARSTDGGATWTLSTAWDKAPPNTTDPTYAWQYDKPWVTCDNGAGSSHAGRCYLAWTDIHLEPSDADANYPRTEHAWNSWSDDGGLTWSRPADVQALGGTGARTPVFATYQQPLVEPDGSVVVVGRIQDPLHQKIGYGTYRSTDGGASWVSGSATAPVATPDIFFGRYGCYGMGERLRNQDLVTAVNDSAGRIYAVWSDSSFRQAPQDTGPNASCPGGTPPGSDVVLATSTDGRSWSQPVRVAMDATTSGLDHVIPGIAVDPATSGTTAHVTVTAYAAWPGCGTTCLAPVSASSPGGGDAGTWAAGGPMRSRPFSADWTAQTRSGGTTGGDVGFVGDYVSTVYSNGRPVTVIPIANPPTGGVLDEHMEAFRLS